MASRKDKKGRILRKGESYSSKKGMYLYTYTDPLGKRRYIYSKDLLDLRDKEKQLQRDQQDGIDSYVAGNADLNFLFDRYMATKTDLRVSTRASYFEVYDRYVREEFGKKKISDIRYSDILYFYTYLLEEKGLHIGTVQYIQRLIHPSLEIAVRDNLIRKNPADKVIQSLNRTVIAEGRNVRRALTIEQQRAFLSFVEEIPQYHRWKPFFTFLLGTGCRIGEAVGIRWEDIDLEERMVNINHSLYYFAGGKNTEPNHWVVNLPKTKAGIRNIPIVDPVYSALIEENSRQKEQGYHNKAEVDGMSGFIFCNRFCDIHNPESVNRMIERIVDRYNATEEVRAAKEKRKPVMLPHFTCHNMRHTFCARLCESETNIKVIQTVMGHKDIQTTMDIYAEVTDKKKRETLDELFNNLKLF